MSAVWPRAAKVWRARYQYFTQAEMQKLRSIGYEQPFTRLEVGIQDYVQNYLLSGAYL